MPRTFLALASLLLSTSALAQNSASPANVVTPAPAPREGTVGPEQLRDFSLPGTRAPAQTPDAAPTPAPTPGERPAATNTPPSDRAPAAAARPATRPATTATQGGPTAPAAGTTAPRSDPAAQSGIGSQVAPQVPGPEVIAPLPLPLAEPPLTAPEAGSDSSGTSLLSWWPWLLVAALAGIGLALLLRQRRRAVAAGVAEEQVYSVEPDPEPRPAPIMARAPAAKPAPEPAQAAPPARARPEGLVTTRLRAPTPQPMVERVPAANLGTVPTAAPTGAVVSRRLRGWIDLDLVMREILFVEGEALIRFDLTVANGGAAPARQVVIEALALNAGETQAEEIGRFFARQEGAETGIAELNPLGMATLSHEIRMPRSAIRAYEAQGRSLFVPVVAFNASYRTAAGEGRTSAAFLVGREMPGSDRLAPLKLEPGAARLLGLGVRRLDEAVRR